MLLSIENKRFLRFAQKVLISIMQNAQFAIFYLLPIDI
uniref:Uncharacterized protein n=1 Tax=Myoviridae sp. ct4tH12 TaxID=2825031 RepID=A0A8S5PX01_9CAUD|nr:MAG TPA: hypothetical protein [Myoviridae sp. ct4tH12]